MAVFIWVVLVVGVASLPGGGETSSTWDMSLLISDVAVARPVTGVDTPPLLTTPSSRLLMPPEGILLGTPSVCAALVQLEESFRPAGPPLTAPVLLASPLPLAERASDFLLDGTPVPSIFPGYQVMCMIYTVWVVTSLHTFTREESLSSCAWHGPDLA